MKCWGTGIASSFQTTTDPVCLLLSSSLWEACLCCRLADYKYNTAIFTSNITPLEMQTIKCWLSLCIMLTTLLKSCHDMFTAALRPRRYYAFTLNQWWCDKLISYVVIVLHTAFQVLPWKHPWKGLQAQCFFCIILILFLIAHSLNICLRMKMEINHNRKKD